MIHRAVAGAWRGTIACVVAMLMAAATTAGWPKIAGATANIIGAWSPVYPWPAVAIHLHLLPDGNVLTYADDNAILPDRQADFSNAYVVRIPRNAAPSLDWIYIPNDVTNLFCAGHAFLPDGRLLVIGGHEGRDNLGSADATIFEYAAGYVWRLQPDAPSNGGRWYASALTLASGGVLALGGTTDGPSDHNPLPQIWQAGAGGWRDLTGAMLQVPKYAKLHLAPNGRVFMVGPDQATRYLSTSGTGAWSMGPTRRYGSRDYGSSVMYDDGKILIAGGGNPPTNTAEIIDLNAAQPDWQYTGPMVYPRRNMNATVLADGTVLATGGSSAARNDASGTVLAAELWDPATGQWATMASMQVARLYHSTAILLPDGRVLSAGGGRPPAINGGGDNLNAEIYSPPYLFKGNRPTIRSAPSRVPYGKTFVVKTPDTASITQVTLVRLSSVTHTVNMNQRFRRLNFTMIPGGLSMRMPSNRNLIPPGHYMLFILNGDGVPSVAKIVRVG